MRNLVIRDASINDIPAIVKVRRAAFTTKEVQGFTTPERSVFYSQKELRKTWLKKNQLYGGWEVVVADENGEIMGFIVFKTENGAGYIDNINIAKEKQRTGVGKALVSHVEGLVRSRGFHTIRTDTTENAKGEPWKSYAFWTKMGYKDTGERLKTIWSFKEIPFDKYIE